MTWETPKLSGRTARTYSALALLVVLGLCDCTSGNSFESGGIVATLENAVEGIGTSKITREDVAAIPFASIDYAVGDGDPQMLILAGQENNDLIWTSSSKIFIETQGGRIVRSVGLKHDLNELRLQQAGSNGWQIGAKSTKIAVFGNSQNETATISCQIDSAMPDGISILGRELSTTRFDESCSADELRWKFRNSYWVETSAGIVWRAKEYIHPMLRPVTIELLRPYLQ